MDGAASLSKKWDLIRYVLVIPRPVGAVCVAFGVVVFIGYSFHIEPVFRPVPNGPATNPLTALSIVLLGLGLSVRTAQHGIWCQRLLSICAAAITFAHLLDMYFGTNLSSLITPFYDTVMAELAIGKDNAMGVNSALMLFTISLAILFHNVRKPTISQVLSFLALGFPMVSFTGYAYGISNFYGQMSLVTATLGFFLSVGALAMTAHRGAVKAILSPYIGGRIARIQVLFGYVVPFLMGFLVVKTLVTSSSGNMFGLFVIAVSWFIIVLVCYSAIIQEQVDSKRRAAERALSFLALNDPLTRLPNRRKFFDIGAREMERALRSGTELWVLMIDLDHFKKINDTGGHAMGDKVLVSVGDILANSIRSVDVAGRIGGEEFAVLLSDTSCAGVNRVAESIRINIEGMEVEGWTDVHGSVTASIGCARSKDKRKLDDVLGAADEALYRAKDLGRNRVVLETEEAVHAKIEAL